MNVTVYIGDSGGIIMSKISFERNYEIGARLREFRAKQGMTQEKMSELLEISKSHYGQVERGKNNLGEYRLMLLAEKLNADITYILTGNASRTICISDFTVDCPADQAFYVEQILQALTKLIKV